MRSDANDRNLEKRSASGAKGGSGGSTIGAQLERGGIAMAIRFDGEGRSYDLVDGQGQNPEGWNWGQVGGVAVDSQDNVHSFSRSVHPYRVFDKSGKLIDHWGEQLFEDAHGICIHGDDDVYLVDRDPQVAFKFNKHGR